VAYGPDGIRPVIRASGPPKRVLMSGIGRPSPTAAAHPTSWDVSIKRAHSIGFQPYLSSKPGIAASTSYVGNQCAMGRPKAQPLRLA
jgi:hypothetical protein